jgi:hypothetical protein
MKTSIKSPRISLNKSKKIVKEIDNKLIVVSGVEEKIDDLISIYHDQIPTITESSLQRHPFRKYKTINNINSKTNKNELGKISLSDLNSDNQMIKNLPFITINSNNDKKITLSK